MEEEIKNCILEGYKKTKKLIDEFDKKKIINIENIELCFDVIESVGAYYKREYEENMYNKPSDKESIHKFTYSVIKALMHLRYFSIDNDKVDKIFKKRGKSFPRGLIFANEFFCWNVLYHLYEIYRKVLISQLPASEQDIKEYPPYCELHFEKTKNAVAKTFFGARNRLGDITPGYIHIVLELLLQKHNNITADLVGKLLNRSGFITYLTYWGKKEATVGFMFCDLDKFKQVNDDNSHEIGDMVLRKVADVLSTICEEHNGIPARVGGEEFWLAFNYTDPNVNVTEDLAQIYKELQKKLKKIKRPKPDPKRISNKEYKKYMTMSVAGGIAPMSKGYDPKYIGNWFDQLDEGVSSIKNSTRDAYKFVPLRRWNSKKKAGINVEKEG
jgi:diguanylate cyclase (GGDEF)-like protein